MIHFARRLGFPALSLACVITLGWPHAVRTSLYRTFYPLVAVDLPALEAPPDALGSLGYTLDDAGDLSAFRDVATSAVAGATTDGAKLRRLADQIYSYHPAGAPIRVIAGGRERGIQAIFDDMRRGDYPLCGHKTLILAALWRSLGGNFRQVRFTTNDEFAWYAAHYGIEVYSTEWRKWFYYDATLNGYATSPSGEPLSLVELNNRLASGDDVAMVASGEHYDWNADQFLWFLGLHRLQVYSLNNRLRGQDPDRRFGRLHFGYSLFSQLPRPLDRVIDAMTGDGGSRIVVREGTPPPAATARMHITASPIG